MHISRHTTHTNLRLRAEEGYLRAGDPVEQREQRARHLCGGRSERRSVHLGLPGAAARLG